MTWSEALDVALCFGWIDGQSARFDDDYTLQSFTPRRKNSPWSQINRDHVARLIAEGKTPSVRAGRIRDIVEKGAAWRYADRDTAVRRRMKKLERRSS